jgi:hypothetical protein
MAREHQELQGVGKLPANRRQLQARVSGNRFLQGATRQDCHTQRARNNGILQRLQSATDRKTVEKAHPKTVIAQTEWSQSGTFRQDDKAPCLW